GARRPARPARGRRWRAAAAAIRDGASDPQVPMLSRVVVGDADQLFAAVLAEEQAAQRVRRVLEAVDDVERGGGLLSAFDRVTPGTNEIRRTHVEEGKGASAIADLRCRRILP